MLRLVERGDRRAAPTSFLVRWVDFRGERLDHIWRENDRRCNIIVVSSKVLFLRKCRATNAMIDWARGLVMIGMGMDYGWWMDDC